MSTVALVNYLWHTSDVLNSFMSSWVDDHMNKFVVPFAFHSSGVTKYKIKIYPNKKLIRRWHTHVNWCNTIAQQTCLLMTWYFVTTILSILDVVMLQTQPLTGLTLLESAAKHKSRWLEKKSTVMLIDQIEPQVVQYSDFRVEHRLTSLASTLLNRQYVT